MKIKPLIITFESLEDFAQRTKQALVETIKFKKKLIQKKDSLVWASPEAYQHFMSDQKYAILAVIIKYKPQSVYQLAKILGRAQQNVARDCDLLEGHGFIKYKTSEEGRKTKVPQLIFDYNAIMVCLPSVTYKVEFEEAA
jgi:predicted transcriptional regulator